MRECPFRWGTGRAEKVADRYVVVDNVVLRRTSGGHNHVTPTVCDLFVLDLLLSGALLAFSRAGDT
jgi:hypothetical protein